MRTGGSMNHLTSEEYDCWTEESIGHWGRVSSVRCCWMCDMLRMSLKEGQRNGDRFWEVESFSR